MSSRKIPIAYLLGGNDFDPSNRKYLAEVNEEINEIGRILADRCNCKSIFNEKNSDSIFSDLQKNKEELEIIHFAGHSKQAFIELSNTESHKAIIKGELLGEFLSTLRNVDLVFLNGCGTYDQAKLLLENGVNVVISTNSVIGDVYAKEFAVQFYSFMVNGSTIRDAYIQASATIRNKYNVEILNYNDSRGLDWEGKEEASPWTILSKSEADLEYKFDERLKKIKTIQKKINSDDVWIQSAEEYFLAVENRLLPITIPVFNNQLIHFESFISTTQTFFRILFISGYGGYGKSHFLREIAKIVTNRHLKVGIVNEIHLKGKTLIQFFKESSYDILIIDDAERDLEYTEKLLTLARHYPKIKIVLSFRSAGNEIIQSTLRKVKANEFVNPEGIVLKDWSQENLIRLLRHSAGTEDEIEQEKEITEQYSQPYLISWIGKNIGKHPNIPLTRVREKLIRDLTHETAVCLDGLIEPSDNLMFLQYLACLIPIWNYPSFPNTHQVFFKKIFKIDSAQLQEIFDRLVSSGILRKIRNKYRFSPDVKGDFLLEEFISQTKSVEKILLFMEPVLSFASLETFTNLSAAAYHKTDSSTNVNKSSFKGLFTAIIKQWISKAEETSLNDRSKRLKYLSSFIPFAPYDGLDLIQIYWELSESNLRSLQSKSYFNSFRIDDIFLCLNNLIHFPDIKVREIILEILAKVNSLNISRYNSSSSEILRKIFHPGSDLNALDAALNHLGFWLKKEINHAKLSLIKEGLSRLLAGSWFSTVPVSSDTFGFQNNYVILSESTIKAREKGNDFIKDMLSHENLAVKLAGIVICSRIGDSGMSRVKEEDLPLVNYIRQERIYWTNKLGRLLLSTSENWIKSYCETTLTHWWLESKSGAENCINYLSDFDRDIDYLFFNAYSGKGNYLITDFSILVSIDAPNNIDIFEERTIPVHGGPYTNGWRTFESLGRVLNEKYSSPQKVLSFLIQMNDDLLQHPKGKYGRVQIVEAWANINPTIFIGIRKNSEDWGRTPDRFKVEIINGIIETDLSIIELEWDEIFRTYPSENSHRFGNFLWLLRKKEIDLEQKREWLTQLIDKGNSSTRGQILNRLNFIIGFEKNPKKAFELISMIFESEDLDSPEFYNEFTLIGNYFILFPSDIQTELRNQIRKKLLKLDDLNDKPEDFISFSLKGFDEFLDFIQARLKLIRNEDEFYFVSVFPDNLFKNYINTFEKFSRMIRVLANPEKELEKNSHLISDLENSIYKSVSPEDNKRFVIQYVEECLENKNVQRAVRYSQFLPVSQEFIPLAFAVWKEGLVDFSEEIPKIISNWLQNPREISSYSKESLSNEIVFLEKNIETCKSARLRFILRQEVEHMRKRLGEF